VIHTKNGRKALLDTLNQDSQFNQADQADQADQAISQSANDNLLQFRWRS
jgi:ABC-type sugar transport system substrate-binding protein